MQDLLTFAASQPLRHLASGEILIRQGGTEGALFVLEEGQLAVERDGVKIATMSSPNSLVGEMSVILGRPNSATVRAEHASSVRVISDARQHLQQDPALTFRIAWLMACRLDATSALLVDLKRQHGGTTEQGLLARIFNALHLPADDPRYVTVRRNDMFGGSNEPRQG